jgi:hypothetical protein
MRHALTNLYRPVHLLWAVSVIWIVIVTTQMAPVVVVEGFEAVIAREAVADSNPSEWPSSRHYMIQPGTYHIVRFLSRTAGISPMTAFASLTGVAWILSWMLATWALSRITQEHPALCSVVLLLFPEFSVAAWYPNSSMIALPFLPAALVTLDRGNRYLSGFLCATLLALGAWMRFDLCFAGCLVLPWLWIRRGCIRASIRISLGLAVLAGVITTVLYALSGISVLDLLGTSNARAAADANPWRLMKIGFFYPPLIAIALLAAVIPWVRRRSWSWVLFVCAAPLAYLVAYRLLLSQPRYLLHCTISGAAGVLFGLRYLASRYGLLFVVGLCVASTVTGVQLLTNEGPRFFGGQALMPGVWREYKQHRLSVQAGVSALLAPYLQSETQDVVLLIRGRHRLLELVRLHLATQGWQEVVAADGIPGLDDMHQLAQLRGPRGNRCIVIRADWRLGVESTPGLLSVSEKLATRYPTIIIDFRFRGDEYPEAQVSGVARNRGSDDARWKGRRWLFPAVYNIRNQEDEFLETHVIVISFTCAPRRSPS